MTDDLVKRLRKFDWRGKVRTATAHEAADRIEALTADNDRLRNDSAKAVMDALWPVLGGNHTDAELWYEINDAIRAALGDTQ